MLLVSAEFSGIDIWYAKPGDGADLFDSKNLAILSAGERHRASRYLSKRDAALFLAARILLRTSLSQYANVAPEGWTFGATPTGRPFITSPKHEPELHFNLSHTDGMVVCAIARIREVGIDVENCRRRIISMEAAKKFLGPSELKHIVGLPSAQRQSALLRYWTLKEAYLKVGGRGMAVPFSSLEFELGNTEGQCSAMFSGATVDDLSAWVFRQVDLSDDHVCSLAFFSCRYQSALISGGVDTRINTGLNQNRA
jgi:4'-phosphopantetheinyl transferase